MAVSRQFLLNALLKENYFPSQKKKKEELPPPFTSSDITRSIAKNVRKVKTMCWEEEKPKKRERKREV